MDTARPIDAAIWTALAELLGSKLAEVCETYIHETQERLIQIHVAIEAQDQTGLFNGAESLKSIALTVGALALAGHAEALATASPEEEPDELHRLLRNAVNEFVIVRQHLRTEIGKREKPESVLSSADPENG
jgi:HPt (histidine-containing phosphotransfer) domain-containing protein